MLLGAMLTRSNAQHEHAASETIRCPATDIEGLVRHSLTYSLTYSLTGVAKFERCVDFGGQAFMNRAVAGCVFDCRAAALFDFDRDFYQNGQANDSPRGVGRHMFFDCDFRAR